jgi:hypothetical protein
MSQSKSTENLVQGFEETGGAHEETKYKNLLLVL